MGPLHGYGIARRIEQISEDALKLNEGTVYASLTRLQHQRWISASWGTSDNNRKAKYYAITRAGRKQLAAQTQNWERIAGVIGRLLRPAEARREAVVRFGGAMQIKEQHRDDRSLPFVETTLQDIRYALRSLRKN